jgi:hypothetical protein
LGRFWGSDPLVWANSGGLTPRISHFKEFPEFRRIPRFPGFLGPPPETPQFLGLTPSPAGEGQFCQFPDSGSDSPIPPIPGFRRSRAFRQFRPSTILGVGGPSWGSGGNRVSGRFPRFGVWGLLSILAGAKLGNCPYPQFHSLVRVIISDLRWNLRNASYTKCQTCLGVWQKLFLVLGRARIWGLGS